MDLHSYPVLAVESSPVHLAKTGCGHGLIRELFEQLLHRSAEFLLNGGKRHGMVEGGQIVLQAGEFLQPVPPDQIRSSRESLPDLDEAWPQVGQGAQQRSRQFSLHFWIFAVPSDQQAQHQPKQCPGDVQNPGECNPRPEQ